MAKFGEAILGFIVGIGTSLLRAFVVSKGWAWFVLPTFGIAVPTILTLWGLSWFFALFLPGIVADGYAANKFNESSIPDWAFNAVLSATFSLLGWVMMYGIQFFV